MLTYTKYKHKLVAKINWSKSGKSLSKQSHPKFGKIGFLVTMNKRAFRYNAFFLKTYQRLFRAGEPRKCVFCIFTKVSFCSFQELFCKCMATKVYNQQFNRGTTCLRFLSGTKNVLDSCLSFCITLKKRITTKLPIFRHPNLKI